MPCLTPRFGTKKDGLQFKSRCNKCSQCKADKIRDYVGRALAESLHSVGATTITLTYGTDMRVGGAVDKPGARVLTYKHVQDWLKRLRRAGYPLRYIVAGEYGSLKQRAHWHVVAFWKERVPPIPEHVFSHGSYRCYRDPFWKFGITAWDKADASAVRYVCKYMMKDAKDPQGQSIVRISKKPLLGAQYFDEWAERHVVAGLPIKDRLYTVPGSYDNKTGLAWRYYMSEAATNYVCASFLHQWRERNGALHPPQSDVVERYLDRLAVPDASIRALPFRRRARPAVAPPAGYVVTFEERLHSWVADWTGPEVRASEDLSNAESDAVSRFVQSVSAAFLRDLPARLVWSFDGDGLLGWVPSIVSESEGRRRRFARYSRLAADAYREGSRGR